MIVFVFINLCLCNSRSFCDLILSLWLNSFTLSRAVSRVRWLNGEMPTFRGLSWFSEQRIILAVSILEGKLSLFFFVIYTDNMIVGLLLPEISPLYGEPNIIFTCWTVNRRCVSSHIYHDFPFFCPCPANVILVFSAFRHLKDGCRLVLLSVVTMANWVWLTQSLRVTCQSRASQVFFYVSEQQYRPSRSHSRHGAAVHIEGRIINWPAVGWIWLLLCESGLNRSVGHTLGVI